MKHHHTDSEDEAEVHQPKRLRRLSYTLEESSAEDSEESEEVEEYGGEEEFEEDDGEEDLQLLLREADDDSLLESLRSTWIGQEKVYYTNAPRESKGPGSFIGADGHRYSSSQYVCSRPNEFRSCPTVSTKRQSNHNVVYHNVCCAENFPDVVQDMKKEEREDILRHICPEGCVCLYDYTRPANFLSVAGVSSLVVLIYF